MQVKTFKLNKDGKFDLYEDQSLVGINNLKNLILRENKPFELRIELSTNKKVINDPRLLIEVNN